MNLLFRNASWQFLNTVITIAFPLAVFPYISRLFGPTNHGELNYVDSWVKLLFLVTTLGLHTYGVREIAAAADHETRSRRLYQLILLHLGLIFFAIIFFSLFEFSTDKTSNSLLLMAVINLAIHPFLAEWYFHGTYQFKWLLGLNLATKAALLIAIFVFIDEKDEIAQYNLLFTIAQGFTAAACAIVYIRQIKFEPALLDRAGHHLKPMLLLLITMGGISMFVYLDVIVLNYLRTETETGIYSVGIKVVRIISYLFNATMVILMPILASHFANQERQQLNAVASKSLQLLLVIGLPSVAGLYFLSLPLVRLLSGSEFLEGTVVLEICAALPLIVAVSNLLGIQLLVAMGKENTLVKIVSVSVFIGLLALAALTSAYSFTGTAIGVLVAETCFLGMTIYYVRQEIRIKWQKKFFLAFSITAAASALFTFLISRMSMSDVGMILAAVAANLLLVLLILRLFLFDLLRETAPLRKQAAPGPPHN